MTTPLNSVRVQMLLDNPCAPDWRVLREAAALRDAGAEVSILCWDREGAHPAREVRDGIVIERLLTPSRRQLGIRQFKFLGAFYQMAWRHLAGRHIDVVHAHDLLMLPLGARVARRAGARLVYDAHEIYHIMESHRYPALVLAAAAATERWLIRHRVDALVTVSQQRVDAYWQRAAGDVPITVVGNWYDPVDVAPEHRAAARAALGIPNDALCVVYAGGLTPDRRIGLLADVVDRGASAYIVVAGRGAEVIERRLRQTAARSPHLQYVGWTDSPQRLFDAADALFYLLDPDHPYSHLAASNTLYLAIARRLPLITGAIGEPGAVMREIAPVLVLERADCEAIERALTALEAQPVRNRVATGVAAWREQLTWARSREALLGAYQSLVARQPQTMERGADRLRSPKEASGA